MISRSVPSLLRPATWRRRLLQAVLARKAGGGVDITSLRRIPDSASFPLRRAGVDPVPELTRARAEAPVQRLTSVLGLDIWLVAGYDEARAVLADRTTYSNDMRHLLGTRRRTAAEGIGGLGMTDAPDHTRLRKLLTPEFTVRRLARLEPRIDAIVEETLDAMELAGPEVDLVDRFGFEIPFRVICDLLGMPVDVRAEFHSLGSARFDVSQGGAGAFGAATESRTFLIDEVARQRANPGDGLIGAILTERGDEFDDVEIGGLADGVFLGGYETSASMLSLGTLVLARHPEHLETLRTGADEAVDAIVDELMRYLCPVQVAFPRFAREDHDLFGQRVGAGDVVIASLVAANRDPAFVPDPDVFDPRHASGGHLSFGHGLHRCVGAQLARMELRAALRGLARRFPRLSIRASADELAFRELSAVYGLERLPVRLWPSAGEDQEPIARIEYDVSA